VARLAGASKLLQAAADAERHKRELDTVMDTASWRMTEPLRRLNGLRRRMLQGRVEPVERPHRGEQLVRAERVPSVEDRGRR
jgi:hypothetical protein